MKPAEVAARDNNVNVVSDAIDVWLFFYWTILADRQYSLTASVVTACIVR